ncbi:MAG: flagellar basal body-associated FliL family protein, partial [Candidatus Puniceispirillum sp.]
MAEGETKPRGIKRFMLPVIIAGLVTLVLGLFVIGYTSLTVPDPIPDDIHSLMAKAKQDAKDKAAAANNNGETGDKPDNADLLPDGKFDFAKFRYFTFPLPFVTNLTNGSGTLTTEIAVATYATTFKGERTINQLETFKPKLRSKINLILSDQGIATIDSPAKRKALEAKLLAAVREVIDGTAPTEPSAITDLHFIKFVIT